jgi:transposase
MRGEEKKQSELFHTFSVETLIPATHPIRRVRKLCDEALESLDAVFEAMYSTTGRPSIAPEMLLKSQILIALYSIRSDEQFCEQLGYNVMFRWFLGMSMSDKPFDSSTFSKNRERLIEHEVGKEFLSAVVELAKGEKLISGDHFTVDGTLIDSWGSMKSFKLKGTKNSGTDDDQGNPTVDFRGEKRTNDTHQSTTDSDAKLYRKGKGKESRLCLMGHALMENRNGLIVDVEVTKPGNRIERDTALELLDRQEITNATLGGDSNYNSGEFVGELRARSITPHVALHKRRNTIDRRTTRHLTYQVSQRKRKLVEQIFGWMKISPRIKKSNVIGIQRTGLAFCFGAAAYNLLRISKLSTA